MHLAFLEEKYRILFNKCVYDKPTIISAMPDMGKTASAVKYCEVKHNCLYFPFANMEADFALRVFCNSHSEFGNCVKWNDFFNMLEILAKEKRLTVFFDNAGVRNDKIEFYEALNLFLKKNTQTAIIFLCRPWEKIGVDSGKTIVDYISLKEIAEHFNITDKEAANIYLLTGGIASILAEYNMVLSFEDNIKNMLLNIKSTFYTYPINLMKDCFRSPEAYNTLLYAIANGYNRISEISAFSGQPKNKCDKYLKTLIDYGFVRKEISKNGYANYYPANSYFSLWYKLLFTAVPKSSGSFNENICNKFMGYFDDFLVPDFYKKLCFNWIKSNYQFWFYCKTDAEIENLKNITLDDITFDFIYNENGRKYYFYYDTDFNNGLNKALVNKIEEITIKESPFYDNEYFYLSVNRIPDSLVKLAQKYDNIHFVRLSVLFTAYKTGENRKHFR